jgi:hypothetical protein
MLKTCRHSPARDEARINRTEGTIGDLLPAHNVTQPALQCHLGQTSCGGVELVFQVSDPDTRLNLRLLYSNSDGRGAMAGILAPVVFSKNAERLGNGRVESLSADVNCMFDASDVYQMTLQVRSAIVARVACSFSLRYKLVAFEAGF